MSGLNGRGRIVTNPNEVKLGVEYVPGPMAQPVSVALPDKICIIGGFTKLEAAAIQLGSVDKAIEVLTACQQYTIAKQQEAVERAKHAQQD